MTKLAAAFGLAMCASPVVAQDYALIEYDTTLAHYATIVIHNEMGSTIESRTFETSEGPVRVNYITNAGPFGELCDTDGGATYDPMGPYEDCPDEVTVETPDGVIADPQDFIIEEGETVRVRLYRWLGV